VQAAEGAVKAGVASGGGAALPGMIFNARKWLEYKCAGGEKRRVRAGRLECTMQNLVDSLVQRFPQRVTPTAARHCFRPLNVLVGSLAGVLGSAIVLGLGSCKHSSYLCDVAV